MRRTVIVLLVWIHAAWAFILPERPLVIHSDRMRILASPIFPTLPRVGGFHQPNNSATLLPLSFFEIFGKQNNLRDDEEEMEDSPSSSSSSSILDRFQKSPGSLVVAPFVLLFALDLVANILVVTKRSIEVMFTGEYTVWNPFQ
jgi:hypothetical protein